VTEAMKKYEIDPSQSYMFGDKKSDTECGERSGVKSFRVTSEHSLLYWANQLKNNLL
jgi:D-glycero-D-manno-heptose 1,7-bisphosphate phosphatase